MLDFEQTLLGGPRERRNPHRSFLAPRPSRYGNDRELGFLPLLAAAIPMVTSLAGSLLSKKSKGGGSPPEAGKAQDVLDLLTKAMGSDASKGETSIKDVVRNIVSTVPSPVIGQVKAALKELRDAEKAGRDSRAVLVNSVDAKFGPQLHALLAGVKASQLQRIATNEHRNLKAKSDFRKNTTHSLASIGARLHRIESRLNRSAIVNPNRVDILGGKSLLER